MTPVTFFFRTTASALLLASLLSGLASASTPARKKPTHPTRTSKAKTTRKSTKKSVTKKSAKTTKVTPFHQSFVPVPQARYVPHAATALVPQQPAVSSDTAVPPPTAAFPEALPATAADTSTVEAQLRTGGSALHFPTALRSWFTALRAQGPTPTTTVRALQFGDSHTAADMFTGELRSQIQARFGNGGVGFTYAGHPFAGYRILGSGRGQSAGWQTLGTHFTQLGDGLLGMGGVAIESSRANDSAQLDVSCLTLQVDYLARAGGGSFHVRDSGLEQLQVFTDTASPPSSTASTPLSPMAGIANLSCTTGINNFQFVTDGDGPVRLLGTTALQPGATWEAIGINGAEAPLILRWNAPLFDSYLEHAAPQLIVLAYGTNEAAARWTGTEYAATFARLIDHLHTLAPGASILVLGPGDRALGTSHTTVTGKGRRTHRVTTRSYVPYIGTARILNAQREVCSTHNCAFWDWQARQGGFGSVSRWVAAGYAQPDHTHLTGTGYRALADALFADLMTAYDTDSSH
jgi:lysophospholipase L1-like esterase